MSLSGKARASSNALVSLSFADCCRKQWEDLAGKIFSFRPDVGILQERCLRAARAGLTSDHEEKAGHGGGKGKGKRSWPEPARPKGVCTPPLFFLPPAC